MMYIDETQRRIGSYLSRTNEITEELFATKYGGGNGRIITTLDLGFPHDVIRIAGGYATGAFIEWITTRPFIPLDTCVNDCSVSLFEVDDSAADCFTEEWIQRFQEKMEGSIYKLNFHRGNHFMAVLRSREKYYLLLHSSANEFKDNYNGLYPADKNYFFNLMKLYHSHDRYIRYLDGDAAELFINMSLALPEFNRVRQEFIAEVLLDGKSRIMNSSIYHHYGMPNDHSVIMGGHVARVGETYPLMTFLGHPVYMVRYDGVKDSDMAISESEFIVPHGLGKTDTVGPDMIVDQENMIFSLDGIEYLIKYGESLRDHKTLKIREMDRNQLDEHLNRQYKYEIVDELQQIVSWNKQGIMKWQ